MENIQMQAYISIYIYLFLYKLKYTIPEEDMIKPFGGGPLYQHL